VKFAPPAAVIVLAAGEGTRMKSDTPKVLHRIGGRSLLGHAIVTARETDPEHLVVVVRHGREVVAPHVTETDPNALVAEQDEIMGTGRATECGLDVLPADLTGTVLVTYGDVPLLTGETLRALVDVHTESDAAVTVVTAELTDPGSYGRVLRDPNGDVEQVVEFKDASEEQRSVREINSGIYAFDVAVLREALAQVDENNAQGERYLTDVVGIARAAGRRVRAHVVDDVWQTEGVNDRVQLAGLARELNRRVCERWMRDGVTIMDPATTWVDVEVTIGRDATILPNTHLVGATAIAARATVGPDVTLVDTEVGEGAKVTRAEAHLSVIGAGASVGPFSYLRPGSELGARGKIGTFVETKNSRIGEGSKVPHLSYVGDATIGVESNIGAASVFVNYDGVRKQRTVVGNHVRMGSDNMYIAPVTIGDGAYSGAGAVIRHDVPAGALAINVAPQRNIEGWVLEKRPGTAAAEAAKAAGEAVGDDAGDDAGDGAGDGAGDAGAERAHEATDGPSPGPDRQLTQEGAGA
jgi:bifunctional UDP-N-acetylglucosamine pyrophosphorylase/glucosamine-1-phosphate N-acetyltransferase